MKMMRLFEPWVALQRVAALGLACLLAACGGGASQVESFKPTRLIAFGDQASAFEADGSKYAVNGLQDCRTLPIWTQVVADGYGFGFKECPVVGVTDHKAVSRASAGAKVGDLSTQVNDQLTNGGIGSGDLVTVLLGVNDVKDLYAQRAARTQADLRADARSRGVTLGQEVNAITNRGARVLLATVPDLGLSPFGISQGASGAALLTLLADALNEGLRVTMINDGRKLALVLGDELVQSAVKNPSNFSLANVGTAACTTLLPDCTTATLVAGADATTWLWADDTWFSYGGHKQLGSLALTRARNNPF